MHVAKLVMTLELIYKQITSRKQWLITLRNAGYIYLLSGKQKFRIYF
jgi:hypothetical protein